MRESTRIHSGRCDQDTIDLILEDGKFCLLSYVAEEEEPQKLFFDQETATKLLKAIAKQVHQNLGCPDIFDSWIQDEEHAFVYVCEAHAEAWGLKTSDSCVGGCICHVKGCGAETSLVHYIYDYREVDTEVVIAHYRNHYECTNCGNEWDIEWDSTCDDRCPVCNTTMSPFSSEDIEPVRVR